MGMGMGMEMGMRMEDEAWMATQKDKEMVIRDGDGDAYQKVSNSLFELGPMQEALGKTGIERDGFVK